MVIQNHEEFCEGNWTREENDIWSVTDYILCNGDLIDKVDKMVIDDEGKLQIQSDHNWMFCDLNLNVNSCSEGELREVWNITRDTNWQVFQQWVQSMMNEQRSQNQQSSIDSEVRRLNEILVQARREVIRTKWVGKRKQKHWMDKQMWEKVGKR